LTTLISGKTTFALKDSFGSLFSFSFSETQKEVPQKRLSFETLWTLRILPDAKQAILANCLFQFVCIQESLETQKRSQH
jgi:hypothetical protein